MKKTVLATALIDDKLKVDQDEVMAHYKEKGAVVTPADEEALHMFFSPARVPRGMLIAEVREVIELYPAVKALKALPVFAKEISERDSLKRILKRSQKKKRVFKRFYGRQTPLKAAITVHAGAVALSSEGVNRLPVELTPPDTMTRLRFRRGINKLKRKLEQFKNL